MQLTALVRQHERKQETTTEVNINMPLDKKSMATERPLKLFLSFLLFVNRTMIDHYIDFSVLCYICSCLPTMQHNTRTYNMTKITVYPSGSHEFTPGFKGG